MKITILNGNPEPSIFDEFLERLQGELADRGHNVARLDLRDLDIKYCIGCFGCWVKTPGECSSNDESCESCRAVIESDFTLWAAPLQMGYPSAQLKMAMDKSIPLIHPYIEVVNGEAHHLPRYPHYPRLGLLVETEPDTDDADLEILADLFSRTALNMKTRLEFLLTTEIEAADVAERIHSGPGSFVPYQKRLVPTLGKRIDPPRSLTIFNGSPRGGKGNTPVMLNQFAQGFASEPGHSFEIYNLNRLNDQEAHTRAFAAAECVWLGFPLYTDAMPAIVKTFIETLAPLRGREVNPPIGFLVQSGFPEALHSRYIERYLEKLAARLGAPYLGTIVKGGGEGVRLMPEEANRKLFDGLQALGRGFARSGQLDPDLLPGIAGRERYPAILGPVFKVFTKTSQATWYWDSQLKENGVYEERFAQPYLEE